MSKEDIKCIEIKNISKDYGEGRGVFDVSFDVYKGECFGFLGPNGAGKSTTIRHLMGFSKPDKGEILINGLSVLKNREQILNNLSYLPGEIALPKSLTGKEFLKNQMDLKHVSDDSFLNFLIDYFEFDPSLLCKDMSLGSKRKLAIISCFLNDPEIIIMDEPSSGLDPEMQDRFINLIKEEKNRGKTLLISSHIFSEINAVSDRIGVIKNGKIVSIINSSDLKHNKNKKYNLTFSRFEEFDKFINLKNNKKYKILNYIKESKEVLLSINDDDINILIDILSSYKLKDFKEIKTTLEDYFMSFYEEDKKFMGL